MTVHAHLLSRPSITAHRECTSQALAYVSLVTVAESHLKRILNPASHVLQDLHPIQRREVATGARRESSAVKTVRQPAPVAFQVSISLRKDQLAVPPVIHRRSVFPLVGQVKATAQQ